MVAAADDDLGAGVDEPQHGLREQLDGLGRGHRAVVDVAADEHGVDPLGAHDVDEVVEVGGLGSRAAPPGGTSAPGASRRCGSAARDPRYEWGATPPVTETRFRLPAQVGPWLAGAMGAEVQAQSYSREERQRYREKVRQNLDVFEKMLNTSSFEFDQPMTGLEIELNLVDADMQPHFHNARGAARDRRRELPDRARAVQHRAQRAAAAAARRLGARARGRAARQPQRRRPRGQGGRLEDRRDRHPADDHARALRGRVDQPQQPLHRPERLDLRRPRRGHLPRHRGPHR